MSSLHVRRIARSAPSLIACVLGLTAAAESSAQPCTVTPHSSWKNTIQYPDEPFRVYGTGSGNPDWVKFTILLCDPDSVYYQDSNLYTFHYNFATERLDPLLGLTLQQFNDVTLHETGQQAVLGAVLTPASQIYPPPPFVNEFGIQLVRQDPYTPDDVIAYFNLVRSTVDAPGAQAFYFPTYEQLESALENEAYLAANGVIVSSPSRWASGNSCYAHGWALGRVRYFAGEDIQAAYLSGALLPTDILLTDGVPAEVPFVQGIMTLTPSTPNSHVAILANSYDIPFVHLALPADAARAQALVDQRIVLRAFESFFFGGSNCDVRMHAIEGVLSEQDIAEILALKELPPLNLQPMEAYGGISANTEGLHLPDIRFFGGKTSNYGFLRRSIPGNCKLAAGLSFDLWNAYLDQIVGTNGRTLREEIAFKLGGYTWPPNFQQLSTDLNTVRGWLRSSSFSTFTQAQKDAIIAVLQDPQYQFNPMENIRFRSSTNVEDSDQFTGAGLYDSYSGCLADDLDGDTVGPSLCDPTETEERGVFRAIKRVYGSFYNDNAFIERLRWDVDETQVGMAVLVHHSTPDPIEMANGVCTFHQQPFSPNGLMVTQLGAVSVANPEGGALPEEVEFNIYSFGTYLNILRYSTLVQLGQTVMTYEADYQGFAGLFRSVGTAYAAEIGENNFLLDFEYKKIAPAGDLDVKQVRKIPEPDTTPTITPFLFDEPDLYCTYQGEYGDVFANHRLKSRWGLSTKNMWLTAENLGAESIFDAVDLEFTDGCFTRTMEGALWEFPHAEHVYDEDLNRTQDGFSMSDLANERQYSLVVENIGTLVSKAESPVISMVDLGYGGHVHIANEFAVNVTYENRVPYWQWDWPQGYIDTRYEDSIVIGPCIQPAGNDLLQNRVYEEDHLRIETTFYWPNGTSAAGYTAPLSHWVETTIEGLTSDLIVLHGWYSQTYRPEHHNFGENFIFEPRLEPGISPAIIEELNAQGIAYVFLHDDYPPGDPTIIFLDDDGCEAVACDGNEDCGYPAFGHYCGKAVGDCDGTGTCQVVPEGCIALWDPVCGCDGNTYGNSCEAAMAGVNVQYEGECIRICGGIIGLPCEDGEFCKLPVGECCCDFQGVCTDIPVGCPRVIDYVCGCDGRTYLNECEADRASMSIDHDGPCTPIGACCYPTGACANIPADMCERDCGTAHGPNTRCYPGAIWPSPVTEISAGPAVVGPPSRPSESIESPPINISADPAGLPSVSPTGTLSPGGSPVSLSPGGGASPSGGAETAPSPWPTPIRYIRCTKLPKGACCTDDAGACTETYQCWCQRDGGVWRGPGSKCSTAGCPWDGRCCVEGACTNDVSQEHCDDLCGLWSGSDYTCEQIACGLLVGGACCLDGTCQSPVSQYYCQCRGGHYFGDFTECPQDSDVHCEDLICGGFAGIECRDGQFCKLPDGHCCCDFQGMCTAIPGGCPLDLWDPVCGCDGVTYAYECFADQAGVSVDYDGECDE